MSKSGALEKSKFDASQQSVESSVRGSNIQQGGTSPINGISFLIANVFLSDSTILRTNVAVSVVPSQQISAISGISTTTSVPVHSQEQ